MEKVIETKASSPVWFMMLVTLTILLGILWLGSNFLVPLATTGLLFILFSALVDKFKQVRILNFVLPSWIAHLLSASTVIGAVFLFGLVISSSADELHDALPRYQERIAALYDQIEVFVGPTLVEAIRGSVQQADIGSWAAVAASSFAAALTTFSLVALYLCFLMAERGAWIEKLPRLSETEAETHAARKIITRISDGVKQYMWVNAATSALSGTVAFLIFWWIDLDFAPLLALVVFGAGFIPNIGAFIGIALPSVVALIQFDTMTPFLIVLFGYGLADQLIANVIQPAMQGRSLNLSTFMVMVSLTFWATIWGGMGAFLAVPMMVVTMVVCAEIPNARWIAVLLSSDGVVGE